jgi:hypothetical protein
MLHETNRRSPPVSSAPCHWLLLQPPHMTLPGWPVQTSQAICNTDNTSDTAPQTPVSRARPLSCAAAATKRFGGKAPPQRSSTLYTTYKNHTAQPHLSAVPAPCHVLLQLPHMTLPGWPVPLGPPLAWPLTAGAPWGTPMCAQPCSSSGAHQQRQWDTHDQLSGGAPISL